MLIPAKPSGGVSLSGIVRRRVVGFCRNRVGPVERPASHFFHI